MKNIEDFERNIRQIKYALEDLDTCRLYSMSRIHLCLGSKCGHADYCKAEGRSYE